MSFFPTKQNTNSVSCFHTGELEARGGEHDPPGHGDLRRRIPADGVRNAEQADRGPVVRARGEEGRGRTAAPEEHLHRTVG